MAVILSLSIVAVGSGPQGAMATNSPSVAQLQEAIAALEERVAALAPLEARIAALEEKLQRSETVAGQPTQEASIPQPLLVSLADVSTQPAPMMIAPTKQPISSQEVNGWSGFYLGASFGYGSGNSKSKYSNVDRGWSQQTSTQYGTNADNGRFGYNESETSTSLFSQEQHYSSQGTGSLRNEGALADLYLGATAHLAPRILAGVQVEGTLSAMPFDSKLSGNRGAFKRSNNFAGTRSTSDGDTSQFADTTNDTGTFTNPYDDTASLELDWMVSIIGRAGWLATPTTLLYGLGGWSYGHFDVEDVPYEFGIGKLQDFGANGPTVGGGLEQKLSPNWSLRAEYRYTNFGTHSFSKKSRAVGNESGSGAHRYSSKGSSACCGGNTSLESGVGSSRSTSVSNNSSKGYFDNDMHVGRIGITRYFNLGD